MYKSLAGIAGVAMLALSAPTPADAFAARHAPGVQGDQANVEQVWHRGYAHRRYYRYPYRYRYGYRRAYPYYPYAYAPYPYYRPYYARPYVGFGVGVGPFGFGVW